MPGDAALSSTWALGTGDHQSRKHPQRTGVGGVSLKDHVGMLPPGSCCGLGQQLQRLPPLAETPYSHLLQETHQAATWCLVDNTALLSFLKNYLHLALALLRGWTFSSQTEHGSFTWDRVSTFWDHVLNARLTKSKKIEVSHCGPFLGEVTGG